MDGGKVVTAFGLLMTVAVVSVIVSQRANTAKIIQALGSATGGVIGAATAPLNAKQ
jgi:hypothetical protein